MPLPLRDLLRILAIAESGSVSQAARDLGVAQPALSKTVSTVESALGIRIFERSHSGVRPTSQGELLLARLRSIQGEVHRLEKDATAIQARRARRLAIGVVPIHPLDQLMRAVIDVMQEFADHDFEIVPDSIEGLLGRLAAGTIDFVFAPLPERETGAGYVEEPIYWEQLVVACGPRSPLYSAEAPTPDAMCQQPWAIGEEGTVSHGRLVDFCRAVRKPLPRIQLTIDVVPARRAAVEHSDMLSIFQYAQVHVAGRNVLRELPYRWPFRRRAIGTVRSTASPSSLHDVFAAKMRSVLHADGLEIIP